MSDPMEAIVAEALDAAGIAYTTPSQRRDPTGLDFRLANGIEIEVKRMHSPRIADQMARAENVIALQGEQAVRFFAELLIKSREQDDRLPEIYELVGASDQAVVISMLRNSLP